MDDEPIPAYMRASRHTLANPHPVGSVEWREWEHKNLWRSSDRVEATRIANERLAAARTALDTAEARAARRVDALVHEAGCERVADPWCVEWAKAMRGGMHCYMGFWGYDPDDLDDD